MGFYNIDFIWFEIISFNYFGDSKEIVQFAFCASKHA